MNDDKIIFLVDIRDELQAYKHYDCIRDAFDALWEGWRKMNIRHRFREYMFFSRAEKNGFIARKDAESLCHYIHSAHVWKCLQ